MKKKIITWGARLIGTVLFLFGLLVLFMLTPKILYANKTVIGNHSIYHNKPIDQTFLLRLAQANAIVNTSELYDSTLKMDICLHDGSKYPGLIEKVLGRDMLRSFYNKIVFTCDEVDFEDNYIRLNEHKWNLTEMLTHAEVHCMQFRKYGLWKSNPLGKHPEWKWEGYTEYMARQNPQFKNLQSGINILLQTETGNTTGWMTLPDSTETLVAFFKYRLLIQYSLEVKQMSFVQLLADDTPEETVKRQMLNWYSQQPD